MRPDRCADLHAARQEIAPDTREVDFLPAHERAAGREGGSASRLTVVKIDANTGKLEEVDSQR
jgi:hypothetical protein